MLGRTVRPTINVVAKQAVVAPQAQRNMATLREIEQRLKSVRNIEKITKSMKMIAATKLSKAQRAVVSAKAYGAANAEVFTNSEAVEPEGGDKLYVVISSDKGLCGGIHSSVSKATRRAIIEDEGKGTNVHVMVVGDKSKAQLSRVVPDKIEMTFNGVGRDIPTFADASGVADMILTSGVKFDSVHLVYNKVISAIAFEASIASVFGEQSLRNSPNFKSYEMEDDATKDLAEFALANAIYAVLVEGHAAEINSRRNAMDNASKNAGDMISSLQLKYNRGRQAVITNELIDIITGASAL